MNFYHFRPSCKVIKRSRISKGPFLANYSEELIREILKYEHTFICNGKLNLEYLGVFYQYSRKVFIGGLPLDITEEDVVNTFSTFGFVTVDWPYKEDMNANVPPKGFAFLLFKDSFSVDALMQICERKNDGYYLQISSKNLKNKTIQVRAWKLTGIDHIFMPPSKLNSRFTVFVGGVPRTLDAQQLGLLMTRLFGQVSYAGIDTDPEYLYPKGSARVTFQDKKSVVLAIKKRFLMPTETGTRKMMEIKPYVLDDQVCDKCAGNNNVQDKDTTLFCPEPECLLYLCEFCWIFIHSNSENTRNHKPLVKQGLDDYMNSLKKRGYDD